MSLPTFNTGEPWTEVSAASLNELVEAVRALQRASGHGVGAAYGGGASTLYAQTPRPGPTFAVMPAVVVGIDEETSPNTIRVRLVKYTKVPPDGNSTLTWGSDPFTVWPEWGKTAQDYEPFVYEGTLPDNTITVLRVQYRENVPFAWFPAAQGSPIFHAVVRDVLGGTLGIIMVQQVSFRDGAYRTVGEWKEAALPPGMSGLDYAAMVWNEDEWSPSANVVKIYLVEGLYYVEQTTKFALAPVDPGYQVSDCWLQG